MHLDLTDLRLFIRAANEGSFTRAAQRQHLSLPAASIRIKSLEKQIGQALFYRQARGVRLTAAGEAFLHHAKGLLRQVTQLQDEMLEYGAGLRGHVRMFANTTAVSDFLPEILSPFLIANPRVNVELKEMSNTEVARGVLEGRADLGIVSGPMEIPGLEAIHFSTDRLVLVVPNEHRLSQSRQLSFADTLEHNHVGMHTGSTLHEFLNQVTHELGLSLKLRIQVNSFDTMCRLINAGVGIGIVPESVAKRCQHQLPIALVELTETWSVRKRHILFRDAAKLSSYAQTLVAAIVIHYPNASPAPTPPSA
jgi:DNA-binding transcriptional LysR family regulator